MEDRATLGSDPIAIAGGYTDGEAVHLPGSHSFLPHPEAPHAINPRGFGGQSPPLKLVRFRFTPFNGYQVVVNFFNPFLKPGGVSDHLGAYPIQNLVV